jgi:hypothetical protein
MWGALWREATPVNYNCCWSSPGQLFSRPSPMGLVTRFEISLFVTSYDSQSYGGGIRPRLHTGRISTEWVRSYFTSGGLPPISFSWRQTIETHGQNFYFPTETSCYSPYVTVSLTRGLVCRLQLLLHFASAVILRSESHSTHDYILLS